MSGTVKNHLLMEKYKDIVNERYAKLKDHFRIKSRFIFDFNISWTSLEIRDLKKARNREGRPKKTITYKVKTSDSFFVKSRKTKV